MSDYATNQDIDGVRGSRYAPDDKTLQRRTLAMLDDVLRV